MQVYGQLENATFENLSSDPSTTVQGRFWYNSTTARPMLDDGTNKLALFRNDQKFIFGNSGTAATNIRLNRSGTALLQLVIGSDVTAEGSSSTTLAQISAKQEGYAAASKPANGNAGRIIWITDTKVLAVDDGASWLSQVDVSTAQTLTNKTLTTPAVDIPLFTDQGSDPSAPAAGKTSLYTKAGHVYKIANGGTATQLAEVGVTNPETVQAKSTTYSALNTDDVILCSGASWSLTLYNCTTASGNKGKKLKISHQGTSLTQVYTILTTSAQTIGGVASGSYALYTNGECLELISDGTNWQIVNHRTITSEADAGALWISKSSAYSFTIPSSSITAGTVYTNNGQTFIVSTTSAASLTLLCYGTGAPSASGTLTFVSGSPSGNLVFSAVSSAGAYIKPTTAVYDRFVWYRTGQYVNFRWEGSFTNSGTSGTGDDLLFLPTGLTGDTTNMTTNTAILGAGSPTTWSDVGMGHAFASGVNVEMHLHPAWPGTLKGQIQGAGSWSTGAGTFNTTPRWSILGRYPVIGWQP